MFQARKRQCGKVGCSSLKLSFPMVSSHTPDLLALLRLHLIKIAEYPTKPPKCKPPAPSPHSLNTLPPADTHNTATNTHAGKFSPPLFHPNVYPSGTVCLSILNEEEGWKPAITIKEILLGIQSLLDEPNPESPAQADAFNLFKKDKAAYEKKIRSIVKDNPAP